MRLTDSDLLLGKEENVSMMDLRSSPGDWVAKVRMGMILNLTHRGKIVTVIQRPEPTALELGKSLREYERRVMNKPTITEIERHIS